MAKVEIITPFILSFEGGWSNNPLDNGGATNKGVTLKTWKSVGYDKDGDGDIDVNDLRLITDEDAMCKVLKPHYWDVIKADEIEDQSVANALADWAWHSGPKVAAKAVQIILNVVVDGKVGKKTLQAINGTSSVDLFDCIQRARMKMFYDIIDRNPSQNAFLKGWLRRVNSIEYGRLILNNGKVVTF